MEDVAVCNDQITLMCQNLVLLQFYGGMSADHIVQLNVFMPVEVEIRPLLTGSVPEQLNRKFLIAQYLFS